MGILLDLESYPFILQGFPRGAKTEAEIASLFEEMAVVGRRAVESGALHVVIALGDENFTAAERRIIANRMSRAPADQAARVVGAFAVIESTIARGVLTALRWLAPQVIPVVAAATPEEAIDLAEKCLERQGVIPALAIIERARIRARRLHTEMRNAPNSGASV